MGKFCIRFLKRQSTSVRLFVYFFSIRNFCGGLRTSLLLAANGEKRWVSAKGNPKELISQLQDGMDRRSTSRGRIFTVRREGGGSPRSGLTFGRPCGGPRTLGAPPGCQKVDANPRGGAPGICVHAREGRREVGPRARARLQTRSRGDAEMYSLRKTYIVKAALALE